MTSKNKNNANKILKQDHVYSISNLKTLTKRTKELAAKVQDRVPQEVQEIVNIDKRRAVFSSVGLGKHTKRLFSPMIKNLMPDATVSMDAPFTSAERNIIKYTASVLYKYYGDPVFEYEDAYNENCVRVKMGQALLRISPKVTANASQRRYDNLKKYFVASVFKPKYEILSHAVESFIKMMNLPTIHTPGNVRYVRGLFAGHSSNVGYPYFSNENQIVDGKSVRDMTVDMTKKLNEKYGFGGMTSIPAMIIGRDQSGGIDFDLKSKPTYEELVKSIDTGKYKESKSRVVGAIDRLSNNNYNVILKAMIDHPSFKNNPLFCGFVSREERFPLYKRFDKVARELNMLPVNIDFSAFDTTVGPELILMATDIIRSVVKIDKVDNKDLYDALAAKAIYTKYNVMNPKTTRIESGSKATAIPSGLGGTGILGVIIAQIAGLYGCISYYGRDYMEHIAETAKKHKTFSQTGLGDDALGLVKKFSDLKPIADIIKSDLGLEISVDSTKTAVGVDFLQELYGDDRILYPSGRTVGSALYTEKPSGLGGAQGDMKGGAQLWNLRSNLELIDIAGLVSYYDKSRLGLFEPKTGKAITPSQFAKQLQSENDIEGVSSREKVHNGNPHLEDMFDDKGDLKSAGLQGFFSMAKKAKIFSDNHKQISRLKDEGGFIKLGDMKKK